MTDELIALLRERGAALVGFGDLRELPADVREDMPFGVSIAVMLTPSIAADIPNGPSEDYAREYDVKNALLDELAEAAAAFLEERGHRAIARGSTRVQMDGKTITTALPHKTVATRAGLGWIGKCALLVTREHGSAVRLGTVLTDAPLPAGRPVNESSCGDCTVCMDNCPGGAVKGANWYAGIPRDELFDPWACRDAQHERRAAAGVSKTGCGLCIALCPHTQKHLRRMGH